MRAVMAAAVFIAVGLPTAQARNPTMTAICTEIVGIRADETAGKIEVVRDRALGATWSYSWEVGTQEATLVLQSSASAGHSAVTERAVAILIGKNVAFVSVLKEAVWVHTIYPNRRKVLVTQTTDGNAGEVAGKMLWGTCQVGIN